MPNNEYADLFFGADLAAVDPDIHRIIELEEERQARRIILIPSESLAPKPVRAALGSAFNNIYAEGYPPTRMVKDDEDMLLQFDHELINYRRYADRRLQGRGLRQLHRVPGSAPRRPPPGHRTNAGRPPLRQRSGPLRRRRQLGRL